MQEKHIEIHQMSNSIFQIIDTLSGLGSFAVIRDLKNYQMIILKEQVDLLKQRKKGLK